MATAAQAMKAGAQTQTYRYHSWVEFLSDLVSCDDVTWFELQLSRITDTPTATQPCPRSDSILKYPLSVQHLLPPQTQASDLFHNVCVHFGLISLLGWVSLGHGHGRLAEVNLCYAVVHTRMTMSCAIRRCCVLAQTK